MWRCAAQYALSPGSLIRYTAPVVGTKHASMSVSVTARRATGGAPPCDDALPGRAAMAIRPSATTNERREVASVFIPEVKGRIGILYIDDFVDPSVNVVQSETHWSELNCRDVIQAGEHRPEANDCCAGFGDPSREELVG
jgi:hypothetical protein